MMVHYRVHKRPSGDPRSLRFILITRCAVHKLRLCYNKHANIGMQCVTIPAHSVTWHKTCKFNVHGSVHRKYILIYIEQDATLHILFISGNCSTYFGWCLRPSSGTYSTVSTTSGTCQTVTANCRSRGGVGNHSNSCAIATVSSNGLASAKCCR